MSSDELLFFYFSILSAQELDFSVTFKQLKETEVFLSGSNDQTTAVKPRSVKPEN